MPDDWKTYQLNEICDFINGFAFKSTDYIPRSANTIEVLRMGYIDRGGGFKEDGSPVFVPREYGRDLSRFFLQPGDIAIAMTDMKDRVAILANTAWIRDGGRFALNQRVGCIRVKRRDLVDARFLYFYSNWRPHIDYLRSRANSGVQVNLSTTAITESVIPLPPLSEQRAISSVLGALDDKIELNRRMNETLEVLAQSLFKSWFVDATATDLPEGWRFGKLSEVLSVIETGGRPKGGVSGITEGVPSVGAESIVGIGRFDYGKTKFVPREFFTVMNRGHVQDGDVLLYKDGGRPGEFEPHLTMVGDGFPFTEFCINEHVYRLRTEPNLPQSFLYFWLSSDSTMDEMRSRGTGVAIPGLNSTQVRELAVLIPSSDVLKEFDQKVSPLLRRIFANCKESRTLAALRDALLPKLLSGELRVPAAAKLVEAAA
jgi:type I restriction enzyme S subunit